MRRHCSLPALTAAASMRTIAVDLLEIAALVHDFQVFAQFDRDCSGAIDARELRDALRKLGVDMTVPDAQEMLDKYDADKSGTIELNEFRKLAEDLPSLIGGRHGQTRGPLASVSLLALPDEIYRSHAPAQAAMLDA